MLLALIDKVGETVPSAVLDKIHSDATGGSDWKDRLRHDLRGIGLPIQYDKKQNGYKLTSLKRTEPRDKPASIKLRTKIFIRDGYRCQICGSAAGETDEYGKPVRLEAGHIIDLALGGKTIESNLQAECRNCNAAKKSLHYYPEDYTESHLEDNAFTEVRRFFMENWPVTT